jgi:threonine synthase
VKYVSTSGKGFAVSLSEAIWKGLADDGGLYLPETLPQLPADFFRQARSLTFPEISFQVARALLGQDIPEAALRGIVEDAFPFDAPLVALGENRYVLELFHGPTLAFKDFGARFQARLMAYLARGLDRKVTVIVATSGDTGSAVAHGFLGVAGIRVVILYPTGRVSEVQEKQLTTLGQNIVAAEVEGSFDDCQRLAKLALSDPELRKAISLTSANSINIARLLPQTFYYFYGWAKLPESSLPLVFSVPSGNFGNLTAGMIARRMGLPVARLIAATNRNDVVPEYLRTGDFRPRASLQTISNAMDVGSPNNFARLLALCGGSRETMREEIWGRGFSDAQTEEAIAEVYRRHGYLFDPHSAVGYLGLETYAREHSTACRGITLATAHPAKFAAVVERASGIRVTLPEALAQCLGREKKSLHIASRMEDLKRLLLRE